MLVYLNIRILVALRKLRQRLRTSQQSKDDNLAFILISTVIMFFFCHLPRYQDMIINQYLAIYPRLVVKMYEAGTIHSVLGCRERGQNITPLWLLYLTQSVQLGMVGLWLEYFLVFSLLFWGCECIYQLPNILLCRTVVQNNNTQTAGVRNNFPVIRPGQLGTLSHYIKCLLGNSVRHCFTHLTRHPSIFMPIMINVVRNQLYLLQM